MGSNSRKAVFWLIGVLLFAAVVRIYLPAAEHGYVFDDYQYLLENARLHGGLTGPGVRWAFATTHASNWHPVTWLSHMLDVSLYGPKPAGHHLTSILIHALSTLLLFGALSRMTGSMWRSAFVAAMFGLHPLHVESVAWVAERKDVLSGLFWMLAMLAYAAYVRKPGVLRYAVLVLASALGLLSKPMVLTLPFVLLLLDYWPLGRCQVAGQASQETPDPRHPAPGPRSPAPITRLVLEKLPLLAMSAVSAAVTVFAQQSTGAVAGAASLPFGMRAANAVFSDVVYVRKMLWPSDLAVYYTHPLHGLPTWQVGGSAALLIVITWVAIKFARQAPYAAVGWLWYLITLVPVIGLVQVGKQAMADRYTYIPLVGLFVIIAWGVPAIVARFGISVSLKSRNSILAALGIAGVGLAAFQTSRLLPVWRDEVTLFSQALKVTEDNWMAHHGLARALDQRGRTDAAVEHYRTSIAIDPTNADVHNGLATALLKKGRLREALSEFRTAVRLDPFNAAARMQYGVALDRDGSLPEAVKQLRRAVELAPDNPLAHQNLAGVLARQSSYPEAIEHYRTACRLTGFANLPAVINLAEACYQAGLREDAVNAANRALKLAQAANKADLVDYILLRLKTYEKQ